MYLCVHITTYIHIHNNGFYDFKDMYIRIDLYTYMILCARIIPIKFTLSILLTLFRDNNRHHIPPIYQLQAECSITHVNASGLQLSDWRCRNIAKQSEIKGFRPEDNIMNQMDAFVT